MKKLLIYFLTLFLITGLDAQIEKRDAFYLSTEGVFGNYSGATLGLNYMSKQKIAFQLGIHALGYKSQYQGESILGGEYDATNEFNGVSFIVGKVFTWEAPSRFILSAGIGSTNSKKAVSSHKQNVYLLGLDLSFVDIEYEETQSLTFIFNPKLEIPVSKIFGISLTSHLLANKEDVAFGIGFGFILGALK